MEQQTDAKTKGGESNSLMDSLTNSPTFGIVGTIARFKPVHNVHAVILESLCEHAEHVYIGLGSCNEYNTRNPFTAQESAEMINIVLKPKYTNYSFIEVPDLHNGPKWREQALRLFGKLDCFVTANDYVKSLLELDYRVIHPIKIISEEQREPVSGTIVRVAIARGEPWEHLVPEAVAAYLREMGLVERFCNEFGLKTIAQYGLQHLATEPSANKPDFAGEPA